MLNCLYPPFRHWSERGAIWVYSDPHFGNLEMQRRRGVTDEEQVRNINACVGKNDTLIILGDVGDVETCRMLRGYKVLVMGNHDAGKTKYTDVFDEVYDGPVWIAEKLLLSHEPLLLGFVFNVHGHDHACTADEWWTATHMNVCAESICYEPVNMTALIKIGLTSGVVSLHRREINDAILRKQTREAHIKIPRRDSDVAKGE